MTRIERLRLKRGLRVPKEPGPLVSTSLMRGRKRDWRKYRAKHSGESYRKARRSFRFDARLAFDVVAVRREIRIAKIEKMQVNVTPLRCQAHLYAKALRCPVNRYLKEIPA